MGCLTQSTPLLGETPRDGGENVDGGRIDAGDGGAADSGFDAGCTSPLCNHVVYPFPSSDAGVADYLSVATGDVNGDGLLDVVAPGIWLNQGPMVVDVFYGQADGSLSTPAIFTLEATYWNEWPAIAVSDLNGDGLADVVTSNGGEIIVFLSAGEAGLATPTIYDTAGHAVLGLAVGDLNGDGYPDIVWSDQMAGGILYNSGDGTFAQSAVLDVPGGAYQGLVVADFNGDGRPDVAVNGTSLFLVLSQADGGYETSSLWNDAEILGGGLVAFEVDGRLDLAFANWHLGATTDGGVAQLMVNDGNGQFQDGGQVFLGDVPVYLTTGDFNADGILDLVGSGSRACGRESDTVMVAFGLSDGGFGSAVDLDPGVFGAEGIAPLGPVTAPRALVVLGSCGTGEGISVLGDASKH
jgi:hypothetical protein